jgi:hypothetical protein
MLWSVAQSPATENSSSVARVLSLFSPVGIMVSKLSLIRSEGGRLPLTSLGFARGRSNETSS